MLYQIYCRLFGNPWQPLPKMMMGRWPGVSAWCWTPCAVCRVCQDLHRIDVCTVFFSNLAILDETKKDRVLLLSLVLSQLVRFSDCLLSPIDLLLLSSLGWLIFYFIYMNTIDRLCWQQSPILHSNWPPLKSNTASSCSNWLRLFASGTPNWERKGKVVYSINRVTRCWF